MNLSAQRRLNMSRNEILKVFSFLQFVEGLISLVCCIIHLCGFTNPHEPTTYQPPFLVIFFGFSLLPLLGLHKMIKQSVNFTVEGLVATLGFTLFLFTSIRSMANVENDPHLLSMTDQEEWAHPYFQVNLYQSVICLINALVFLMHSVFAVELIINPPKDNLVDDDDDSEDEVHSKALDLCFFPERVWLKLVRHFKSFKCCRK